MSLHNAIQTVVTFATSEIRQLRFISACVCISPLDVPIHQRTGRLNFASGLADCLRTGKDLSSPC